MIQSSRHPGYAWLHCSVRKIQKRDLERARDVLAELCELASVGLLVPDAHPAPGSALSREPFVSFAWPFLAEPDRGAFREATATAFRARAFAWAGDPVTPLIALMLDQLCGASGKPMQFINASLDALSVWLSKDIESDSDFRAAFDSLSETMCATPPAPHPRGSRFMLESIPAAREVPPMSAEPTRQSGTGKAAPEAGTMTEPGAALDRALRSRDVSAIATAGLLYRQHLALRLTGSVAGTDDTA